MADPFAVPGFGPPAGARPLAPPAPARPSAWGVSALLLAAGDALSARFGAVTVRGELSGATRAGSGHCYFTLKDASGGAGALRCAMFKRAAALSNVPLQDGLQVELRGRLAVYEARGELQMVVESMQRLGAGQLYEEFLRLRARLAAEGLFDPERKRPLPPFVRTVGVVTSTAGAALHDVAATLARRAPHVQLIVYPSLVQGADAPAALVAALAQVERRNEVDAVLVCRGGGSLEDLWAFNDERVVRAIDAMSRPVVSGVGHETDVTLVDLVADLRAATPTAAAEAVAIERAVVLDALTASARRLGARVEQRLQAHAQRLDTAAARLARPAQALAAWRQRVQRLEARHEAALRARWQALARTQEALGAQLARAGERALNVLRERHQSLGARFVRAAERTLSRRGDTLRRHEQALSNLDPQRVLERGYTLLESRDGRALVSAAALQAGQGVVALLHDGRADLRVEIVHPASVAPMSGQPATALDNALSDESGI
jgi:exodeoxyribonuclease VII large subunit